MTDHKAYSDFDFVAAFQQCTLLPGQFSHEAHLRLAWLYLGEFGLDITLERLQDDLKKYVDYWGASDKYNSTLTIASVRAVHHFRLKSKSHTFFEFISEFPRLKYEFKEVLGCHYTTDIFTNKAAKQIYLEPELLPFD